MSRTWIGLDSSLVSFGYAVMRQHPGQHAEVMEMGSWKTKPTKDAPKMADRARRVKDLGVNLLTTLQFWDPTDVYIESLALGMRTGMGTVQTLGRVRGLVEGICLAAQIPLAEVRPEQVKFAVTGQRGASKDGVWLRLRQLYNLSKNAKVDLDASDALAVAHVGSSEHRLKSGTISFREALAEPLELDF